ncbi:hypothetical protein KKB99_04870 [bacterium]|nr:hypothetical protein [bacterium]MBU1025329.1 hypothetical protein [bacterium]
MKHIFVILTAIILNVLIFNSGVISYPGYGSGTTDSSGTATSTTLVDDPKITNIFPGEKHFANMRMLTVVGENAEAYWNSDGTKLVLQIHVGDGNCDQIYVMDLETCETELVSTGKGVTTCAYWKYPENDKIIYGSTHLAHNECPKSVERSKGYIWRLHPEYDVFEANPDGTEIKQLTFEPVYDAEATFAHDGSSIIYTSLSTGDLELWTMDPDGSNKKQMTNHLGYDGGAFFSWDGTKIVWRAYYPETDVEKDVYLAGLKENSIRPMPLQIRMMDRDGSNVIQITDNGNANFCPFFMPGDERIIFASNYQGSSIMDFNLWIVDVDGNNLEQLTFYEGFDAFPMFSPDGTKLVFGSNRNQRNDGDTNIFLCDWVD